MAITKRTLVVRALLEAGWRPPPLPSAAADRLIDDLGMVRSNATLVLTAHQLRILELSAQGYTQAETAKATHCAHDTVRAQIKRNILPKLGARNMTHAVALALERGLIQLPEEEELGENGSAGR